MENDESYVYKRLDNPGGTIRLIQILSTTPRIHCESRVVSLEEKLIFSALSYVWGDANVLEDISLDGKSLSVTMNLAHALRDVHNQWSQDHNVSPETTQWLWADAICINQKDVEEKNCQVPLMETIYSNARIMFAWIGVDDEVTRNGIESVELVGHEISKLSYYPKASNLANIGIMLLDMEHEDFKKLSTKDLQLKWSYIYTSLAHTNAASPCPFQHIHMLWSLPYWRRLWILQEIILARSVILLSGAKTTNWTTVCNVLAWIRLFRNRCSRNRCSQSMQPSNMPISEWHSLRYDLDLRYCANISFAKIGRASQVLNTQPTICHDQEQSDEVNLRAAEFLMNGCLLLSYGNTYLATNPKDYVYAMGSVSGIRMRIDYAKTTTVADVYRLLIVVWLQSLELITRQRIDSPLCNLWFLELAGCGFPWERDGSLTSWLPNFAGIAGAGTRAARPGIIKDGRSDSEVFPENIDLPTLEGLTLRCTGIIAGTILEIGPCIDMKQHESRSDDTMPDRFRLWIFDCAVRSTRLHTNSIDEVRAFASVLYHQHRCALPSIDVLEIFTELLLVDLAHACEKWRDMPRATFLNCIGLSQPPVIFYDPPNSSLEERHMNRWWEVLISFAPSSDRTANVAFADQLMATFFEAYRQVSQLRMAYTESKHLGMFPPDVQEGDLICVLKGFPLPVVLRKHDGGGYIYQGACHVPGIMNGEARNLLQTGKARLEDIRIH
jgi:hypothetical protein